MVEAAALIIAGIALAVSVLVFRRQMASNLLHVPEQQQQPMFRRAKSRPVVRDDLAAFRQEEKERYEWEAKLREQER